jgi:hypothetical protein
MDRWMGAEDWEVVLPTSAGPITLHRRQERLDVSGGSIDGISSLELDRGPEVSQALAEIRARLASASAKYGTAQMSGTYRLKVTIVLLVSLLLNAGLLHVVRRFRPTWSRRAGFALMVGWLLVCYFFIFVRVPLF